jgi:hypothetical protein
MTYKQIDTARLLIVWFNRIRVVDFIMRVPHGGAVGGTRIEYLYGYS